MTYKPRMGSGDYGETDVMGMRVKKTSDVIMLNALIDEINAIAGVIRSYDKRLDKKLLYIENINSLISSNISGYTGDDKIEDITADITMMIKNSSAINTKKFVFFGEDRTSSILNLIRTKIRLAEIIAWKIKKKKAALCLNRLSDLFFIYALKYRRSVK